jgi:hypothetical protein
MNARQTPFHTIATDEISAAIHTTLATRFAQGYGPDVPHRFAAERLTFVHCIAVTTIAEISACWQLVGTGLSVPEVAIGRTALQELAKVRVAEAINAHNMALALTRGRDVVVDCSVPVIMSVDANPLRQQRQALNVEILKAAVQQVLNWNLLVQQGDIGGWPSNPAQVFAWAVEEAHLGLNWAASRTFTTYLVDGDLEDRVDIESLLMSVDHYSTPPTDVTTALSCSLRRTAVEAMLGSAVIRSTM